MSERRTRISIAELHARALSACVGPALVLDAELRIVLATPSAHELLGFEVELGTPAPRLLCGKSPRRPLADALAAGRAVKAVIPHPSGEQRMLKVRSLPLPNDGRPGGWVLLLDAGEIDLAGPIGFFGMWTQTGRMKETFRIVERVAPEDATVLVRGETGTGKELVARALHALSPRSAGPFRAINCAALPSNLLESELFGHVRGAFTGAIRDTPGHLQLAHNGTLFLDEVAELPLELQAKLLRALETRSIVPVGGRQTVSVNVRIVSATHRSLRGEVEAGRFRADLMYRLRVIPIFLPPLRERREDIGLLCERFIQSANETARRKIERVAPSALSILERYDWPGNVRELHNALAYAYAIGRTPILQPNDLPEDIIEAGFGATENVTVSPLPVANDLSPEARRIVQVLERTGGNKQRAARILGMSRVTLWRRLRALGLEPE